MGFYRLAFVWLCKVGVLHEKPSSSLTVYTISFIGSAAPKVFSGTYADANDPNIPADFAYQGEYAGSGMGAQVIALDNGAFKSFFSRRVAGSGMGR